MKLSIIIPAYNEEENIEDAVCEIESTVAIPHELLIVNDHSNDSTCLRVAALKKKYSNIILIDNQDNPGFANTLKSGFRAASTNVVVAVMGDLCDDMATIGKMFDKINEGYDIVCGSRYLSDGARVGGPKIKGFLSYLGGVSLHYLLGIPTHDLPNAFKMYRKEVLDNIEIESTGFEISMEIPLKAYYQGFKITEVPTVWRGRTKGKTNFKVLKLLPRYLKLYFWAIKKRVTGLWK